MRNKTMNSRYLLLLLLACPLAAQAEIYKHVDKDGHVTYSSSPIKGAKRIFLEPPSTYSAPSQARRNEANFPKVDGATQRNRDDMRRQILEDELAAEQKLLDEAQRNLKDGQDNPEVYRGKDGKTYRNVAKYDEKVKTLTEELEIHQRNVEALKTELSRLK